MSIRRCIAIDAMGGEGGPQLTVPATLSALRRHPALSAILVGDEETIHASLANTDADLNDRVEIVHAPRTFLDTDKPASILRSGRTSSLYQAVELHKQGRASAVVSAGNTGALLILGRHLLKTIPNIELPAIVATLPISGSNTLLLDVGANLSCSPQQLLQFAIMGSVLAEVQFASKPRVALLNVGEEPHKGTEDVRATAALLEACSSLNYIGFIEANQIFSGQAEVIVCDGFVGNVLIKAGAGAANAVIAKIAGTSSASQQAQLQELNPQRFNGASLLGLQGNIVKSHGNADELGFGCAIDLAYTEQRDDIPELIRQAMAVLYNH